MMAQLVMPAILLVVSGIVLFFWLRRVQIQSEMRVASLFRDSMNWDVSCRLRMMDGLPNSAPDPAKGPSLANAVSVLVASGIEVYVTVRGQTFTFDSATKPHSGRVELEADCRDGEWRVTHGRVAAASPVSV